MAMRFAVVVECDAAACHDEIVAAASTIAQATHVALSWGWHVVETNDVLCPKHKPAEG